MIRLDPASEASTTSERTPTQVESDARDWTFGGTWPYEPRWLFTDGIRLHYVDEGPRDADPVVLLHRNPGWSYDFREVTASLAGSGRRAIAYDRLGFGRSDKPIRAREYSLERDVAHLDALLGELSAGPVSLVFFESAAAVALSWANERADRVRRLGSLGERPLPGWVAAPLVGALLVQGANWVVRRHAVREAASEGARAAYLAPHPSSQSRAGILASLRADVPESRTEVEPLEGLWEIDDLLARP